MRKNNNTYLWILFFLFGTALLGNNFVSKKMDKKIKKTEVINKKINDSVDSIPAFEKQLFYLTTFENARDSLLIANGFYNEKYNELKSLDANRKELDSIENKLAEQPQLTKLKKSVQVAADNIIDKYAKQIAKIIAPVNDTISYKSIADAYKNSGATPDLYMFVSPKKNILNGQTITLQDTFLYKLFDINFVCADTIENNINSIKKMVHEQCKKMELDLYNSRKNIEKKFAHYYSSLNPENIPEQYKHLAVDPIINQGDWGTSIGYTAVGDVFIGRNASFFLNNFDLNFLEDKNTELFIDKSDYLHIKNDSLKEHKTYFLGDLWDTIAYNYKYQDNELLIDVSSCLSDNTVSTGYVHVNEVLYSKPTNKIDTINGYAILKEKRDLLKQEIERKCNINIQRHDSIVLPATKQAKEIADKIYWNKYHQKYR